MTKSFSGVQALRGVDLEVRAGEVHCVLGQNGAGKSTLIKTLAGVHRPDGGEISWQGEGVEIADPQAAIDLGIATMYQELDVVDGLTIAENIFLGHEIARGGFTKRSAAAKQTTELLRRLGHSSLSPHTEVGSLSAANKQIVSMARALSHDIKLIIMDEPSAVLDSEEVKNLFAVVRELTAEGIAVVYITHRLEEIRAIGDRITVLKDGRTTAVGLPAADTPTSELIRLMTGREITNVFPERVPVAVDAPVVLEVSDLALAGVFSDVSFSVRAGEVVGLAGLVGSGRSEILETVYGARRSSGGSVSVRGRTLTRGSVFDAVKAGVGLSPEERKSQGLVLDEPIFVNATLATMSRFAKGGFLDDRSARRAAREQLETLELRPADPDRPRARSPAATSRRSCSRAGSSTARTCCCSTSRPAGSTSAPAPRSTPSSATSPPPATPSSWSRARSKRCSDWPTSCSSWPTAGSSARSPPTRSMSTVCSTSS